MSARAQDDRRSADTPRAPLKVARRRSRHLIRRKAARRVAPAVILAGICAGAIVCTVLLEQVMLAQSAFKVAEIRKSLAEVEARHEELLLEAARLESPDRIERVARRRLGMVEPAQIHYMVADVRTQSGARLARSPSATGTSVVGGAAAGSTGPKSKP